MDNNLHSLQSLIITAELLTNKLREIQEDPRYTAVFSFWNGCGEKYSGPFYIDELESLERAIKQFKNEPTAGTSATGSQQDSQEPVRLLDSNLPDNR